MTALNVSKKQLSLGLAACVVALTPALASAATQSTNTTVTATVDSVISISAGTPSAISITPVSGGSQSSQSHVVTVNSNNTAGYTLTLSNADATTTLSGPSAATIAASSNTTGAPAALANNTWGFAVAGGVFDVSYSAETNVTSSATKWAGVPALASPYQVKQTAAVATNDTTTVWYAVKADTTKPNGNYTDTVTYTATTR